MWWCSWLLFLYLRLFLFSLTLQQRNCLILLFSCHYSCISNWNPLSNNFWYRLNRILILFRNDIKVISNIRIWDRTIQKLFLSLHWSLCLEHIKCSLLAIWSMKWSGKVKGFILRNEVYWPSLAMEAISVLIGVASIKWRHLWLSSWCVINCSKYLRDRFYRGSNQILYRCSLLKVKILAVRVLWGSCLEFILLLFFEFESLVSVWEE